MVFFIGSNRFQPTGIHVPGELEFLLIHLFIPRPDQSLWDGWKIRSAPGAPFL